jgi:hypothetical protein
MGIDIYAKWRGQNSGEELLQTEAWLSATEGRIGYLREAYHGAPYATRYLCAEAFDAPDGAHIPASVLRERLPATLALVEERERELYRSDADQIAEVQQSFRDFVTLCEEKEKEAGEAVHIVASY